MATFGNINFSISVIIPFGGDTKTATPYTVSHAGNLQYVEVVAEGSIFAGRAKVCIYTDAGGAPANLIATSTEIASFTGDSTVAISGSFTAGTYWIAILTEGHSGAFSGLVGPTIAGTTVENSNTYTSGPSNPFNSATTIASNNFSVNVVYTPTDLAPGSYLGEITAGPQSSSFAVSPFQTDQVWVLTVIPPVSGTINQITYFMGNNENGGGTPLARFLVYDNINVLGADIPHNLIGHSADVMTMVLNENTIALTSSVSLTGGQKYYIGVQSRLNMQTFITITGDPGFIGTAAFSGGAPSVFPSATPSTFACTFWASFAIPPTPLILSAKITALAKALLNLIPVRFQSSALWRTDTNPSDNSTYNEGGAQLGWVYQTVLLPDNLVMAENMIVETDLAMSFLGSQPVVTVTATDADQGLLNMVGVNGGQTDTLWNSFDWNEAPWNGTMTEISSWDMAWTEPLVFKQIQVTATGVSETGFQIGNLYLKYQTLGYLQQLDSGVR